MFFRELGGSIRAREQLLSLSVSAARTATDNGGAAAAAAAAAAASAADGADAASAPAAIVDNLSSAPNVENVPGDSAERTAKSTAVDTTEAAANRREMDRFVALRLECAYVLPGWQPLQKRRQTLKPMPPKPTTTQALPAPES
mmetsp:Transcript_11670/g.17403  ORF Transcript_11670/g.17403 Transcript_11670/m.17403 type:complete len:143 (+) Transcript_11670:114-542(+)